MRLYIIVLSMLSLLACKPRQDGISEVKSGGNEFGAIPEILKSRALIHLLSSDDATIEEKRYAIYSAWFQWDKSRFKKSTTADPNAPAGPVVALNPSAAGATGQHLYQEYFKEYIRERAPDHNGNYPIDAPRAEFGIVTLNGYKKYFEWYDKKTASQSAKDRDSYAPSKNPEDLLKLNDGYSRFTSWYYSEVAPSADGTYPYYAPLK